MSASVPDRACAPVGLSQQAVSGKAASPSRDFVHEHFRSHYPEDAGNWESDWCGGGVERRYRGSTGRTIFPEMAVADGLRLSVQGHFGAYSYPRGDFEEFYSQVEIMGPKGIPELAEYERDCNSVGDEMIYPYVPVGVVNSLIANRGGLGASGMSPGTAEIAQQAQGEAGQPGGVSRDAQTPDLSPTKGQRL